MKLRHISITAVFCMVILAASHAAAQVSPADLNAAIEAKARELQEIQRKLQETQKQLDKTSEKSRSLGEELTQISGNIKQLDLGIRKNTVTIGKLTLEIGSLESVIRETDGKIAGKKKAIGDIMRATQAIDDESPLIAFIKSETLAEAVDEASRLGELNENLSEATSELERLNGELAGKLGEKTSKKRSVETEHKALAARKTIVEDVKKERQEILKETKNQEKTYQQIVTDLAKRQAEIAAEIEAIDAELRRRIDPKSLPTAQKGVLGWPVAAADRLMTQSYGATAFALSGGYKGHWHNGIDIGGAYGSAIVTVYDGTVVAIGDQDRFCRRGAYGKFVVVKHPNNLVTLYAHLSAIGAEVGARVNRGDVIGYMGKTGYALGTHLHFTVYDATTFAMRGSRVCGPMPSGGDLDPQKYL